jgi:hypothetical protein
MKRISTAAPSWLAALATIAATTGFAGCGGSGGSGGTKSLSSIESCLTSAGYKARTTPFGQQLSVALPSKPTTQAVTVTIQPSSQKAASQVGDQNAEFGPQGANTGGGAVSQGQVVLAYARPVPGADLNKIKSCAF